MTSEIQAAAEEIKEKEEQTPIVTHPIPGVEVTVPAEETIKRHFIAIAHLLDGMRSHTNASQNAKDRLAESHFWTLNALNDKKIFDAHMKKNKEKQEQEQQEEQEKKPLDIHAVTPGV